MSRNLAGHARRMAAAVIATVALAIAGCSTAPSTSSGTEPAARSSTAPRTTSASAAHTTAPRSSASVPSTQIPSCSYPVPPLTTQAPEVPPLPADCQFTGASPGCPVAVTAVVEGGITRAVATPFEPTAAHIGGFGSWGGREGSAMCFGERVDQSVIMTNGDDVTLVVPGAGPIVFADRTDLARSQGVRALVTADVAEVRAADPSRPHGVATQLDRLDNGSGTAKLPAGTRGLQVVIAPVSSGPATITVLDSTGHPLGSVIVP